MDNRIAIIENNKVSNILMGDSSIGDALGVEYVDITGMDDVKIGDDYVGGNFTHHEVVVEAIPQPEETITAYTHPDETETPVTASISKVNQEINWRDSELAEVAYMEELTEHPDYAAYMTYIQQLNDYPESADFPNGTRPVRP